MPIQLNDGLYGATITGAFLKDDGSALGLKVIVDEAFTMDGHSERYGPETGSAYLNFRMKSGQTSQRELDTALKILAGIDTNTWDNFEAVVQSLVQNRARVYLEVVPGRDGKKFTNVRATPNGGGAANPGDAANARRNVAMLTRGIVSAPAPQPAAPVASPARLKLREILQGMATKKEDWRVHTGGRKLSELLEVEVENILHKMNSGPDLTPPVDDIPI